MANNNAFYVYGIVKFGIDLDWKKVGLKGRNVYMISKGNFSALVHECREKPYNSENPEEIKEMIVAHNKILDGAMKDFNGVIPLSFNTIIKKGKNSPRFNLKKWLNNNEERLEKLWKKIKMKKEYGIRIYYEKDKLTEKAVQDKEVRKMEKSRQGKSQGLSYLLQGKIKSKIKEITLNKTHQFKQEFYDEIKKITKEVKVNASKILLDEEKDLLLNLSVLIKDGIIDKIKKNLEKRRGEKISFQIIGPFAPYSFMENGK